MNKLLCILLVAICLGCTSNFTAEKFQNRRDNIINVHDKIVEIDTKDVLIGSYANALLMNNYLIISDIRSVDKLLHIFDKKDFHYVTSVGDKGEGPNEITNMGYIGVDKSNKTFYVSDHGKQKITAYNLDSVIKEPLYTPWVKIRMNTQLFPSEYQFINDSLCLGRIIEPIGNADFKPIIAKWNIENGKIEPMKYEHPKIKKKRMTFAMSNEYELYVEFYNNHDLMTICDFNGELRYNVYGPNWRNGDTNNVQYFSTGIFCGDKIFALYAGRDSFIADRYGKMISTLPTKILVFNLNGDYIETLETGYRISHFCYDKDENRLILSLDDIIQFAYLDLDKLASI